MKVAIIGDVGACKTIEEILSIGLENTGLVVVQPGEHKFEPLKPSDVVQPLIKKVDCTSIVQEPFYRKLDYRKRGKHKNNTDGSTHKT